MNDMGKDQVPSELLRLKQYMYFKERLGETAPSSNLGNYLNYIFGYKGRT